MGDESWGGAPMMDGRTDVCSCGGVYNLSMDGCVDGNDGWNLSVNQTCLSIYIYLSIL